MTRYEDFAVIYLKLVSSIEKKKKKRESARKKKEHMLMISRGVIHDSVLKFCMHRVAEKKKLIV